MVMERWKACQPNEAVVRIVPENTKTHGIISDLSASVPGSYLSDHFPEYVMMRVATPVVFTALMVVFISCTRKQQESMSSSADLEARIAAYAPTAIKADLSMLTVREKQLVSKLIEAGKIADEIFWTQTAPDAVAVRDSLSKGSDSGTNTLLRYVNINYGPYDRIFDGERFVGTGPAKKPPVSNYYPQDMTREEFELYVRAHPAEREALESQYTVVVRDGDKLRAVPFHEAYPETGRLAALLDEAAALADNPSLRNYLQLRAKAIRTDDYFESDMAWMDLKDNNVDVVIGPIENYEDALFNYKTAYECAVVVKDLEGTRELQMFKEHIDGFEHALPEDPRYIRASAGSGNILEVVNVVYFGGDFQQGVKTIAASLPNDPRVTQAKGGKKQMYRNLMEAKFDNIVLPIARRILEPSLLPFVDRKAFTSFVTLHEVSHTLGRAFVYGQDSLSVRRALKERYSAVEECKADVLGLYNNRHLLEQRLVSDDDIRRSIITYVAGLYRSLRFGAEEAHGRSNLVQLNFLREKGVIRSSGDGRITIDEQIFLDRLEELARMLLTIEAEGDYARAGKMLDRYGRMNADIQSVVDKLADIPRDLDTRYEY